MPSWPTTGSGSVPTVLAVTNPDLVIVRFHGRNCKKWYARVKTTGERFDYLYSEQELRDWVPNAAELAQSAQEMHVFFNNNNEDFAVRNGRQFRMLLRESVETAEVVAAAGEAQNARSLQPRAHPGASLATSLPACTVVKLTER